MYAHSPHPVERHLLQVHPASHALPHRPTHLGLLVLHRQPRDPRASPLSTCAPPRAHARMPRRMKRIRALCHWWPLPRSHQGSGSLPAKRPGEHQHPHPHQHRTEAEMWTKALAQAHAPSGPRAGPRLEIACCLPPHSAARPPPCPHPRPRPRPRPPSQSWGRPRPAGASRPLHPASPGPRETAWSGARVHRQDR